MSNAARRDRADSLSPHLLTKLGEGVGPRPTVRTEAGSQQRGHAANGIHGNRLSYHLAEYNDNNHAEFAYIHPRCRAAAAGAAAIDIANVATVTCRLLKAGSTPDAATGPCWCARRAAPSPAMMAPWRFGSAGLLPATAKPRAIAGCDSDCPPIGHRKLIPVQNYELN